MTLRELIEFLNLNIYYPATLENFEILNESNFCRYPLMSYFASIEFQQDIHNAEIYWQTSSYEGVNFYFLLHRDKTGSIYLELVSA